MKFGQFIEHNMRNIVLEKSYIKRGGETSTKTFSKKSKLSISTVPNSIELAFTVCTTRGSG